ncbi:MAG: hypothetical protein FWF00_02210 [Endomicrobia bacterium]|nr:hypothetical protein [Endomicrobiia bacterium]MCL2506489.1 hypothetical protein [Endomicrobiia bacterium]
MKNLIFTSLSLLFFSAMVFADNSYEVIYETFTYHYRPYISIDIQGSIISERHSSDDKKSDLNRSSAFSDLFSVALGIKQKCDKENFTPRVEISYLSRSLFDIKSHPESYEEEVITYSEQAFMLNIYVDRFSNNISAWYIGLGGGISAWEQSPDKDNIYTVKHGSWLGFILGFYFGWSFTMLDPFIIDVGINIHYTTGLELSSAGGKVGLRYTI